MREEFGYPEITEEAKEKILGLNAARRYGIDPGEARGRSARDDLGWIRAARAEFERTGVPIST
jgi:hypothetical protein